MPNQPRKLLRYLFVIFLSLSFSPLHSLLSSLPQEIFHDSQTNLQRNNSLLLSSPRLLKPDGRPAGTVGVILYTYNPDNDVFILLGRERLDQDDEKAAGTYSEFGGSMEIKEPQNAKSCRVPESFIEGCIRECREESAGIYDLDKNYILERGFTYYKETPKRQIAIVILKAPYFEEEKNLLEARNSSKNVHYHDKDNFKWLKLGDILSNTPDKDGRIIVKDIHNNSTIIRLRSFFSDFLKDSEFQVILSNIQVLNHHPQNLSKSLKLKS